MENEMKEEFLVSWGEGYLEPEPRKVSLQELIESPDWELDDDFIGQLKATEMSQKIRYEDLSGEVFFERIFKREFEVKVTNTRTITYVVSADFPEDAEEIVIYNSGILDVYDTSEGAEDIDSEEIT
jgi:hypothetical protein